MKDQPIEFNFDNSEIKYNQYIEPNNISKFANELNDFIQENKCKIYHENQENSEKLFIISENNLSNQESIENDEFNNDNFNNDNFMSENQYNTNSYINDLSNLNFNSISSPHNFLGQTTVSSNTGNNNIKNDF